MKKITWGWIIVLFTLCMPVLNAQNFFVGKGFELNAITQFDDAAKVYGGRAGYNLNFTSNISMGMGLNVVSISDKVYDRKNISAGPDFYFHFRLIRLIRVSPFLAFRWVSYNGDDWKTGSIDKIKGGNTSYGLYFSRRFKLYNTKDEKIRFGIVPRIGMTAKNNKTTSYDAFGNQLYTGKSRYGYLPLSLSLVANMKGFTAALTPEYIVMIANPDGTTRKNYLGLTLSLGDFGTHD